MADPKLAEALNPRLAKNRRLAAEGEAVPALPDTVKPSPVKFTKGYSPEERAKQNAALAKLLSSR